MKLFITGGAGFIGSTLVRMAINEGYEVVNLDALTYASNLDNLRQINKKSTNVLEKCNICDRSKVQYLFDKYQPDALVHLAAETHVDRSIENSSAFIETNILGTYQLLEASLDYYETLSSKRKTLFRFIHISTDEVFGALDKNDDPFDHSTPYNPRSPYSSSKAASDHLVRAWHHTYNLPIIISNCSNNYGPYQFPEKFIPLLIINGLEGKSLPIYGSGENIRDWIFVDDHCSAILKMIKHGNIGKTYLVGGGSETSNIDTAMSICSILDEVNSESPSTPHNQLIKFVSDRPGHDYRYAIDTSETKKELKWDPKISFSDGLRKTINWYMENTNWWKPLLKNRDATRRSGLRRMK